jgi:predicted TIM-barrel fold metal-dependent hydrolase
LTSVIGILRLGQEADTSRRSAPDPATRKKILVDNPARLYTF